MRYEVLAMSTILIMINRDKVESWNGSSPYLCKYMTCEVMLEVNKKNIHVELIMQENMESNVD